MKKFLKSILGISLLIFLNFCQKEEQKNGPIPLEIEVDSTKIGALYIDKDYGIKFSPPLIWQDYQTESSKRVESIKEDNRSITKRYTFEPRYVFFDYAKSSILNVGEVKSVDTTGVGGLSIQDYIQVFTSKYSQQDITQIQYLKGNIILFHILHKIQNIESFKYIFKSKNNRIIQFDYTIRAQNRDLEMPLILSSLGSLQLIN